MLPMIHRGLAWLRRRPHGVGRGLEHATGVHLCGLADLEQQARAWGLPPWEGRLDQASLRTRSRAAHEGDEQGRLRSLPTEEDENTRRRAHSVELHLSRRPQSAPRSSVSRTPGETPPLDNVVQEHLDPQRASGTG